MVAAFIFAPFGIIYGTSRTGRSRSASRACSSRRGCRRWSGSTSGGRPASWTTGPEDDPAAPISAAEGEYGFFSPHSWWPLPLAAGAALMFLGLAVGWWLLIIGSVVGGMALIGWTFEYFRGENAV